MYVYANFQAKRTALTFSSQICSKLDLGLEIHKTYVGIRVSILDIPWVSIFSPKRQLWIFRPKFAQKWVLGSEFQMSKSGFGISTSKIPCVLIFIQNGEFFDLNFGKLLNYVQYFGSNNFERAEWRLEWAR